MTENKRRARVRDYRIMIAALISWAHSSIRKCNRNLNHSKLATNTYPGRAPSAISVTVQSHCDSTEAKLEANYLPPRLIDCASRTHDLNSDHYDCGHCGYRRSNFPKQAVFPNSISIGYQTRNFGSIVQTTSWRRLKYQARSGTP